MFGITTILAEAIPEAHMPPLAHGRAKMRWMQPFWRITTSPSCVSSYGLMFEFTEFSRAKLGLLMVRDCMFCRINYLFTWTVIPDNAEMR